METFPKFRVDLVAHVQKEATGKTRVILKDPVSDKYYRLSPYEFTLLQALDGTLTLDEAVEALRRRGHYYAPADARFIVGKAAQIGLLLGTRFGTARMQEHLKSRIKQAKRVKFFSSVYFLFIPLVNPDRFLERTLWLFNLAANRWTVIGTGIAFPGAVYFLIAGYDRIRLEYLFFFNWENLIILWITIALTKLVHEFSHAYIAKRFGLTVPDMGVAFLIFFPCLYCNTTDAWQLADNRQRAIIGAAGILAEAVLAIFATYVWYFSQPGLLNSLAFYLMAVSFISTILFNGNPLIKFDGYFILIDLLGMPNLAMNSYRYLKYVFMNRVMGVRQVPNPAQTPRESRVYFVYGILAFLYRIFLYIGLSIGVYYRFDKSLGIVLAVGAVALFIVRPLFMGVKALYANRKELQPRRREFIAFAAVIGVVLVVLCVPWSSTAVYPCFVGSRIIRKLTVPLHTQVKDVFMREGLHAAEGHVLFQLDTTLLKLRLRQAELQRDMIDREIQLLLLDEQRMSKAEGKEVERRMIDGQAGFLKEQLALARSSTIAPFDGVVTSLDYRFQAGYQPGEGAVVGELQSATERMVHALVPAKDVESIQAGREVEVWLPLGAGLLIREKIASVKSYSETDLRSSPFSSRLGGEVATEVKGETQRDAPLEAWYDCSVNLPADVGPVPLGMTGRMAIPMPPRSIIGRLVNRLLLTFNRESIL